MVVQHRRRSGAVTGPHLGQVLPHGDQLDSVRGTGCGQAVKLGQGCDVGRLVEHNQQRRIKRLAATRVAVVKA